MWYASYVIVRDDIGLDNSMRSSASVAPHETFDNRSGRPLLNSSLSLKPDLGYQMRCRWGFGRVQLLHVFRWRPGYLPQFTGLWRKYKSGNANSSSHSTQYIFQRINSNHPFTYVISLRNRSGWETKKNWMKKIRFYPSKLDPLTIITQEHLSNLPGGSTSIAKIV